MDEITQMDVYKMPGIADLPMSVRAPFGKAWFAEYNGNTVLALELLDQAVEAEAKLLANVAAALAGKR